ncbi:MAG: DUF2314 domain-containing protein [Pirellulales bacterium]
MVPGLDMAMIKVAFSDAPRSAQAPTTRTKSSTCGCKTSTSTVAEIYGILANEPHALTSVHAGDPVAITGRRLTDWMYVLEGRVYGGFTVDVMRTRMPKGERAQHDEMWGLDFGPAGVVDVVPRDFADPQLRQPETVKQDYGAMARIEHPMSVNMRDSLDKACRADPNFVREPDDRGFTFLHQLALAGSLDGVDVCLTHGEDVHATTSNGLTPLALAKVLGWHKVEARLLKAGAK